MRTRVKICGITRIEDALSAVHYGADAIGLVFYAPSPRNVSFEQAAEIVAALPPFVSVVGLFVNAKPTEIEAVLKRVHLDCLQFHGDESAKDCAQINMPYYKAVRVKSDTNLLQYATEFRHANALLLDTYSDVAVGGTGQVFDWQLIPPNLDVPVILAGGLTVDNVASALRQVKPYAVDVSGGVESSKGIKDKIKIASFIREVDQFRS
ncbi:MAG: N-(5'-phosphoribosyl)anthranilate isomerase [Methylophilaceae bacterium 17-44-8]|nr:MAG: N-(5'-phosphoribosyl)anthranilate isomerase [Methylophilales bacterium 28-44-11]OYY95169.1 MAG: N-(5'-phosphoribosyl)anthranilate isomerase [Methylophilales bacterium 16-45-7]OZA06795.1 MAG: N-(5'-phosphoribosyl)anthranilate isomerase [Methylophilaceae bacterium 17-44-8]